MLLSGNQNSEHFSGKQAPTYRPPLICSTRDKFLATPDGRHRPYTPPTYESAHT